MNTLYVVVPCYNEEEVLPETAKRLGEKLRGLIASGTISGDSRIMLVNDGSRDRTWELITELHATDKLFCGVSLSRNKGHQNALLAGLMTARQYADVTISMDADLQDDIGAVDEMLEKYRCGCEIVYGVRSDRETDSFAKRFTAEGYYKFVKKLGGEVVFNHADYRLMSRRALNALSEYSEVNMFLRGVVPMLGYKSAVVEYERGARFAGESKYSASKMISLAMDGITSLSSKPIRYITITGILSIIASLVFLIVFIIGAVAGSTMLNWKILLFAIVFFGGLILTALGIVGEYIGKIYLETKKRPRYFIEEIII